MRWILRSRYKLAESHSDCSGNERARYAAVFSSTGPRSLQWQLTRALRRTRSLSVLGVFGTVVRFSSIAGASSRKDEFSVISVTLNQHVSYSYCTTPCKRIVWSRFHKMVCILYIFCRRVSPRGEIRGNCLPPSFYNQGNEKLVNVLNVKNNFMFVYFLFISYIW